MRLLFVTPRYCPHAGGIETVVKSISEKLKRFGHEVLILTGESNLRDLYSKSLNGIEVFRFFTFSPFNAYHAPSPRMFTELLKTNFDVIHIFNIHAVMGVNAAWFAKLFKKSCKLVLSPYYHGSGHSKLSNAMWFLYRPFAEKILQYPSIIIANSKIQRSLLISHFHVPEDKIRLIYDGVNVERIKKALPFYAGNNKIILSVSRLEKYKNVHLGIYALKHLPKNFRYVIIGKGPFLQKIRKIVAENNLEKRVSVIGYQPDSVVWRWLNTASVFLQLSEKESFGMTCLESLAAGTPVIVNDDRLGLRETAQLFPEYIKMFDVKEGTPSDLAKKIIQASEMKPINADLTKFSWDYIANQLTRVYGS